ncbi:amidoligase family protein [Alicyclobacillus macrosporangiidus]|uniref:Putative amidoligase enzyme n=1 Tax=Alicyclobacillus macrosporangiidus TaxID=392015 RepID=A0A1I7L935_9BACL|nr:amidoligase family protein [Alicyclobacillus macrosporangiidus]SFV06165.1 Putative amidoligase enzyme [Alicyclobacillus macrosporangiidus]
MPVSCAVCAKHLTHPVSVQRGTGPVCARHVNEFIALISAGRAHNVRESWAQIRRREVVNGQEVEHTVMLGVGQMAIANAKARYLARIRHVRDVPVSAGLVPSEYSATRRRNEDILFERFGSGAALVHSGSERDYVITTDRTGAHAEHCSCPDHWFRNRPCRHMQAYELLTARQREDAPLSAEQRSTESERELRGDNRITAVPTIIGSTVDREAAWENERDRNLYVWQERHAHDGVFVSESDEAWVTLRDAVARDGGLGEYETEHVLDGVDTTFGIELEVEGVRGDDVALALHRAGLSDRLAMGSYTTRFTPGTWGVRSDASLVGGCEIVSPVLRDTPETWQAISEITRILHEHGAQTSQRTGFHIHMAHDILDDRGYRWQRLGRYMVGYSREYLQMGATRSRLTRPELPNQHRGTNYTQPLRKTHVVKLRKNDTAMEASRKIIGYTGHSSRYKMVNTAKFVEHGVPTVEFRYPNGTVDPVIIQRQVQLANATLMQSAYLRKDKPGADRLPRLFSSDRGVELEHLHAQSPESRFRLYLDTFGSERLRRIAAGLWVRGAVPAFLVDV